MFLLQARAGATRKKPAQVVEHPPQRVYVSEYSKMLDNSHTPEVGRFSNAPAAAVRTTLPEHMVTRHGGPTRVGGAPPSRAGRCSPFDKAAARSRTVSPGPSGRQTRLPSLGLCSEVSLPSARRTVTESPNGNPGKSPDLIPGPKIFGSRDLVAMQREANAKALQLRWQTRVKYQESRQLEQLKKVAAYIPPDELFRKETVKSPARSISQSNESERSGSTITERIGNGLDGLISAERSLANMAKPAPGCLKDDTDSGGSSQFGAELDDMDAIDCLSPLRQPRGTFKHRLAPLTVTTDPLRRGNRGSEVTLRLVPRYTNDPMAGYGDYYILSDSSLKFSSCSRWGCSHHHWNYKMLHKSELDKIRLFGKAPEAEETNEEHEEIGKKKRRWTRMGPGSQRPSFTISISNFTDAVLPRHRRISTLGMSREDKLTKPVKDRKQTINEMNSLANLRKQMNFDAKRVRLKYDIDITLQRRLKTIPDEEDVLIAILHDEDSDEDHDSPFRYKKPYIKRQCSFEGDKMDVDKYFDFHHKYNFEPTAEIVPPSANFGWRTGWDINAMDVKEFNLRRRHSFHGMRAVKRTLRMKRRHSYGRMQYATKQIYMIEAHALPALNMRGSLPTPEDQSVPLTPASNRSRNHRDKQDMTQEEVAEARRALLSKADRSGLQYKMKGRTIVAGHVEYVDLPVYEEALGRQPKNPMQIWPNNESPLGLFDPPKYLVFVVESDAEVDTVQLNIGDQFDIANVSALPVISPMFTQFLDLDVDANVKTIRIKTVVHWRRHNVEEIPPTSLLDLLYVLGVPEEDDVFQQDDQENFLQHAVRLSTKRMEESSFFFRRSLSNGTLVVKTYLLDGCLLTDGAILVRQTLRHLIPEDSHWKLLNMSRKAVVWLNRNSNLILRRPFLLVSRFMIDHYQWGQIFASLGFPEHDIFSTPSGKILVRTAMTAMCEYGMMFEFVQTNPQIQFSAAKAVFDFAYEHKANSRSSVDFGQFIEKRPGLRIGIDYLIEEGYCLRVGMKRVGLFGVLLPEFQLAKYAYEDSLLEDGAFGKATYTFCDARSWSDRMGYIKSMYSISNAVLMIADERAGFYDSTMFSVNTVKKFFRLLKTDVLQAFFLMKNTKRLILDGVEFLTVEDICKVVRLYKTHGSVIDYIFIGDSFATCFDPKRVRASSNSYVNRTLVDRGLPVSKRSLGTPTNSVIGDVLRKNDSANGGNLWPSVKFFRVPISMHQLIDRGMVLYEERVAAAMEEKHWFTAPRPLTETAIYKQVKKLTKWAPDHPESLSFCDSLEEALRHYMAGDIWQHLVFVSETDPWWADYTKRMFEDDHKRLQNLMAGRRVWCAPKNTYLEITSVLFDVDDVDDQEIRANTPVICIDHLKKESKEMAGGLYPFLVIPFHWAATLPFRAHNVVMYLQEEKSANETQESLQTIYPAMQKCTRRLTLAGDKKRWSRVLSNYSHVKQALPDLLSDERPLEFPNKVTEADTPLPPDETTFAAQLAKTSQATPVGAQDKQGVNASVKAILLERKKQADLLKRSERKLKLYNLKVKNLEKLAESGNEVAKKELRLLLAGAEAEDPVGSDTEDEYFFG